jgi:elongation factor Ts
MQITSEMVRDLRDKTGAGMMDCKRALAEAGGSMEQAIDNLRKKGLAAAAKKASRIASEGTVAASVGGGAGALVEVNCETDFVAKTEDFQGFVREVAALVHARAPKDLESALLLPAGDGTLSDRLTERVAKIGEKISFRRFARFALPAGVPGAIVPYIHAGGKIGVLIELHGAGEDRPEIAALGKDLAMQVAEMAIYREQALAAGKPEKILDKIAAGKLEKFYGDFCLVEQAFIKDPDRKVKDLLKAMAAAVGAEMRVAGFTRFQVGEGMEKRSDDLAAEVARQLGKG